MDAFYNLKEAMKRLGVKSLTAFYHLKNKYPEAFVILKHTEAHQHTRYDKDTLDKFADEREHFRQEKPLPKEYYTFNQAMERLGMWSMNGFRQLQRKYPEVFVNINRDKHRGKNPRYDKAAIDKFADEREHFKQEKS